MENPQAKVEDMTQDALKNPSAQLVQQVLDEGEKENQSAAPGDEELPAGVRQRILEQQIIETLCTIYDPEIPVDIYELGLIYDVKISPAGEVELLMTLTSPACPVAGTLPIEVENKIAAIPGVSDVHVELTWEPPYSMEMMSDAARLQLGLM